jgi:hypothetical protein
MQNQAFHPSKEPVVLNGSSERKQRAQKTGRKDKYTLLLYF